MLGLAVLAVLTAVPAASAATRYVGPAGSDAAACTARTPCATLSRAYATAGSGDTIQIASGAYPAQRVPSGSKTVTFRADPGTTMRELDNSADNVTFDGIDVDSDFQKVSGFENHGAANVTFRNGRIGNVTDEKGALVSGANFTFDNVVFHDVLVTHESVHNECVYAIVVPGMTVRNSTFYSCATMDLFFTYGHWWSPLPPAYGDVTIENNVFGHSTKESPNSWHYYSLYVGDVASGGGELANWTVRNNTFEIAARMGRKASRGSRWVGNLGSWDCVPGVTYSHNVGTKCSSADKAIKPAASTKATAAPFGWIDPLNNDFRLRRGSPAIDAADPADAPPADRDGKPRDGAPDAGAFEYGVGGSTRRSRIRVRSARLAHKVICRSARKRCPSSTKLRIRLSARARVVARIERVGRRAAPRRIRTISFARRTRRAMRIKARGLRAGRYRIVIVATSGADRSKAKTVRLRVR